MATDTVRVGALPRLGTSEPVESDPQLQREVSALLSGTDLSYCFQCGVCTASCPTVDHMEYGPRRLVHMVRLGLADAVLRSKDLWQCVSCYSCMARCPQGIAITELMSSLRNMAIAKGMAKDKEAVFSRVFVEVLQRYGRMYEPEVMARYMTSQPDVKAMLKMAPLGLNMVRKGKLGFAKQRIEGLAELAAMAEKLGAKEGT